MLETVLTWEVVRLTVAEIVNDLGRTLHQAVGPGVVDIVVERHLVGEVALALLYRNVPGGRGAVHVWRRRKA